MHVKIYTVEETWYEGQALGVVAQGVCGGLEILPGHASLLSLLTVGPLVVRQQHDQSIFFISSGVLHVLAGNVTILADNALRARDLDEASANKAKQQAMERLANKNDAVNYSEVLREIAFAREQLRVIRMSKKDG